MFYDSAQRPNQHAAAASQWHRPFLEAIAAARFTWMSMKLIFHSISSAVSLTRRPALLEVFGQARARDSLRCGRFETLDAKSGRGRERWPEVPVCLRVTVLRRGLKRCASVNLTGIWLPFYHLHAKRYYLKARWDDFAHGGPTPNIYEEVERLQKAFLDNFNTWCAAIHIGKMIKQNIVQICNRLHMSTVCIHVCCGGLCIIRPAGPPDISALWADNIQATFFRFLFRSDFYPHCFFFWQSQAHYKSLKNYHFRYFLSLIIWAPACHVPALKHRHCCSACVGTAAAFSLPRDEESRVCCGGLN